MLFLTTVQVLLLFSKIWELPDGLYCHFLQKRSTNLTHNFEEIFQKTKDALLLKFSFYEKATTICAIFLMVLTFIK